MQANFRSIAFCAIMILSLSSGKVNAGLKNSKTDTICCTPDSLKLVSTNHFIFCVSWRVSTDSNCRTPYGFELQWRRYLSSDPWKSKVIIYNGGTSVSLCDSVDTCRSYQWRVRTICDTLGSGTYSDWVYGSKFVIICIISPQNRNDFKHLPLLATKIENITANILKPQELRYRNPDMNGKNEIG